MYTIAKTVGENLNIYFFDQNANWSHSKHEAAEFGLSEAISIASSLGAWVVDESDVVVASF